MKKILPEFEYTDAQLNNISSLAGKTGLCVETVKILYGRGADTVEKINAFLSPSEKHFLSPFLLHGMREAVELITRAKNEDWSVVVYGDYDADGVCASTIMSGVLKDFGIEAHVYVPERRNGYGLNENAIDEIFEECCPQLFITVDCGISNAREVEYIKEQGAEVIVTDHHELPSVLPDCVCVNPKFQDDYQYDNLCGAGVAFKVGCALNGDSAYKYLDFAAIATVADSVPLTGENRDIVAEGLKLINKNPRNCYLGFINKSEYAATSQTLAFSVAPKINAAGRMGDANAALRLFCSEDESEVYDLSVKLTLYNQERQKYCDELYLSAKQKLAERGSCGKVIMLWDDSWNTGFVGIVAARLAEEYARPALLFVKNGDMLKGSARSVEAVNIFEALKACSEFISEYGGHSQAAGVNITEENFSLLEAALNKYLQDNYPPEAFLPCVYVSGILNGAVSPKFVRELERLEPFGVGNKRPLFMLEQGATSPRPVKAGSPHLAVKCDNIELLYFSGERFSRLLGCQANKKFIFEYNRSLFRGREYIKGYVKDIIYSDKEIARAESEIAANNLLNAGCPAVECKLYTITKREAEELLSVDGDLSVAFVANEYATLAHYKNSGAKQINLFAPANKNMVDTVLVSPLSDVDFSPFKRVVFLDRPLQITNKSLEGKEVLVCGDYDGALSLKNLDCDRLSLLTVFREVSANAGKWSCGSAEEAAKTYNLACGSLQTLFALKVFEQLNLVDFKDGKMRVNRGIKTDLGNSQLYRLISDL